MKESERRLEEQRTTAKLETLKLTVQSQDQEEIQKHRLRELAQDAVLKRAELDTRIKIAEIQANAQRESALAAARTGGEA